MNMPVPFPAPVILTPSKVAVEVKGNVTLSRPQRRRLQKFAAKHILNPGQLKSFLDSFRDPARRLEMLAVIRPCLAFTWDENADAAPLDDYEAERIRQLAGQIENQGHLSRLLMMEPDREKRNQIYKVIKPYITKFTPLDTYY